MKIKISLVIFILLSFFNIGAVSDGHIQGCSFNDLESVFMNKSEFIENGFKVQYKTKNNIEDERERIKKYLISNFKSDYKAAEENNIDFDNDYLQMNVQLWNDEIYTYTAITVVNDNINYKTEDLACMIEKLMTDDSEEVQCYKYYKGKILSDKECEYTEDICNHIYKANTLRLNNGYTGSGYCSDGEKINFAISNYNTGAYIIIGTPIIFTTY